jgi:hypothetical protein
MLVCKRTITFADAISYVGLTHKLRETDASLQMRIENWTEWGKSRAAFMQIELNNLFRSIEAMDLMPTGFAKEIKSGAMIESAGSPSPESKVLKDNSQVLEFGARPRKRIDTWHLTLYRFEAIFFG